MNWWQITIACWMTGWLITCIIGYFVGRSNGESRKSFLCMLLVLVLLWPYGLYIAFTSWIAAPLGGKKRTKDEALVELAHILAKEAGIEFENRKDAL